MALYKYKPCHYFFILFHFLAVTFIIHSVILLNGFSRLICQYIKKVRLLPTLMQNIHQQLRTVVKFSTQFPQPSPILSNIRSGPLLLISNCVNLTYGFIGLYPPQLVDKNRHEKD